MSLSETEYVALVAEAIHRSTGVELDEIRLGVALAMIDEAQGRRARRARRSIDTLRPLLGAETDLSLTAAIPTFRFALAGHRVHVLFRDDYRAEATHKLYGRIAEELHLVNGVALIAREPLEERLVNYSRPVVVGGVMRFVSYHANSAWRKKDYIGILRDPELLPRVRRKYRRLTTL